MKITYTSNLFYYIWKYISAIALIPLLLSWCSIWVKKPKCVKQEIIENLYSISVNELQNICNYKEIALDSIEKELDSWVRFQSLYNFLKQHKETWLYVMKNIDIDIFSYIDKLKLYYVLWIEYEMTEKEVETIVGKMKEEHKGLYMSSWHFAFWELLLTTDYNNYVNQESRKEIEWWYRTWSLHYLRYDHVKYLNIIFSLEPQRLIDNFVISDVISPYETLQDDESKELYVSMFRDLYQLRETKESWFKNSIERLFEIAEEKL